MNVKSLAPKRRLSSRRALWTRLRQRHMRIEGGLPVCSPAPLAKSEPYQPRHEEDHRDDPQHVNGKAHADEDQGQQKQEQDYSHVGTLTCPRASQSPWASQTTPRSPVASEPDGSQCQDETKPLHRPQRRSSILNLSPGRSGSGSWTEARP
jgi:hypothetical protein